MNINRWIWVPLLTALFYAFLMLTFGQIDSWQGFLFVLVAGAGIGFLIQYTAATRARKISKDKDARAFDVYQKRTVTVLTGYENAFNFCREAVLSLERGKLKNEDFQNGTIKAVNRLGWRSYWATIDFKLKKINQNLIEIELSVSPVLKTQIVSDGQGWQIAEGICDYIKQKDAEINQRMLADSVSIMEDVYVKPFQKEKVR